MYTFYICILGPRLSILLKISVKLQLAHSTTSNWCVNYGMLLFAKNDVFTLDGSVIIYALFRKIGLKHISHKLF